MSKFHVTFTDSGVHFEDESFKVILAETALELNVREDQLIIDPDEENPDHHDNVRLYSVESPVARIMTEDQYQKSRS